MIAVDLGSNTIRFIEYDGVYWGKSFEKIVRTAETLQNTNRISDQALHRIIDAINEAKAHIDFSHQSVEAYTTAAMRLASNSHDIIDKIKTETGIVFKIITSEKEAELTLSAVRYRLHQLSLEPVSFLLADIGGGSTELIQYLNDTSHSISLNIGIVTLSESVFTESQLKEKIQIFKSKIRESLHLSKLLQLVLTAGTPTTIAAYLNGMDYKSYDPKKINGYVLSLPACYSVYNDLLKMDEETRARYVGVGRENLIIAGILMVTAIYEVLHTQEAIIIDDGLREGIALEYYKVH
ncbi:phosphatase [Sulfuricurvum sp.]|uniref:Ppx/GppA phosphatase family protein n=1 Tax=Sulfuricurvum sp. TaxID=2025608 RepID=UPI00286E1961|nr:phosphatase [Sulfuricurvum sp.]